MTEICKDCKQKLKLIREYNEDGFDYYEYQCLNEECDQQKWIICVCDQCEHSESYWEEE